MSPMIDAMFMMLALGAGLILVVALLVAWLVIILTRPRGDVGERGAQPISARRRSR